MARITMNTPPGIYSSQRCAVKAYLMRPQRNGYHMIEAEAYPMLFGNVQVVMKYGRPGWSGYWFSWCIFGPRGGVKNISSEYLHGWS